MAKNNVVSADNHKAAFKVLVDFFLDDIVQMFAFLLFVDHELFLQLDLEIPKTMLLICDISTSRHDVTYRKTVFVDGDFLDKVATTDAHFFFRQ